MIHNKECSKYDNMLTFFLYNIFHKIEYKGVTLTNKYNEAFQTISVIRNTELKLIF